MTGVLELPVLAIGAPIAFHCRRKIILSIAFGTSSTLLMADLFIPHGRYSSW